MQREDLSAIETIEAFVKIVDAELTASQKVQFLCCAASFVTAEYSNYASFLRICTP